MEQNSKAENTINIVLYRPEIPANTGNIGRLCVGANATLHLIKPFKFFINDKYIKRAGLDYWEKLKLFVHNDFETFQTLYPDNDIYLCSTKGKINYHEIKYKKNDILVFGPESKGLPETMLAQNKVIKIPMHTEIRSINLCNSVAIILYESLRQMGFDFENKLNSELL